MHIGQFTFANNTSLHLSYSTVCPLYQDQKKSLLPNGEGFSSASMGGFGSGLGLE